MVKRTTHPVEVRVSQVVLDLWEDGKLIDTYTVRQSGTITPPPPDNETERFIRDQVVALRKKLP